MALVDSYEDAIWKGNTIICIFTVLRTKEK